MIIMPGARAAQTFHNPSKEPAIWLEFFRVVEKVIATLE